MNKSNNGNEELAGSAIDDQKEIFDPHRVYAKGYYFKSMEMDFVFQWLLGSATTGGCEIGEVFYAAGRIDENDPNSWQREWFELGRRKEARADIALKKGNKTTACQSYLLASNYYRSSITSMLPSNPEYLKVTEKSYRCLEKGGSLKSPAMVPIEIPFEDTVLPGYFWPAADDGTPRETLLMVGGGECFITDNFFYIGPQAHERGYNFVTMDIPGQGVLPAEGHIYRKDSEAPVSAVIDVISKRPDVDAEKLAVIGISFGGYFAPRAATADKRIKAVITNAAVIDNYEMYSAMPFSNVTQEEIDNDWSDFKKGVMENVVWRVGLKPGDIRGQAAATRDFQYDPSDVTCPVLNIVGEGEAANPEGQRQGRIYMENVSTDVKSKVITPLDEGAAAHCTGENRTLMAQEVFDWLDDIF